MNHEIEKDKPQWKLSYKVFEDQYGYDPLLEISPHPTLFQLKDFLGGIRHCVTVVSKWIFDSNITFALPINN